jgi:hypothetical protein
MEYIEGLSNHQEEPMITVPCGRFLSENNEDLHEAISAFSLGRFFFGSAFSKEYGFCRIPY